MRKLVILSTAAVIILFAAPLSAEAHVKWFTDIFPEKETIDQIISHLFLFMAVIIALLLAGLAQYLPVWAKLGFVQKTDKMLDHINNYTVPILKYGLAISLILQMITGTIFVPEFAIDSNLELIFMGVAVVLLIIPHHWASKAGALVILGLFTALTARVGIFHMLDYSFYLTILIVLLLEKTKFSRWGFPILYLGTGLSLCWVAAEKWVFPSMAIQIVEDHNVPTFGFAPDTFITMAAFIEFVVGYLLIVGILNRLLSLVLTGIFVLTTMLFGMTELVGHFMIHIILVIFVIEGVSFYKPPIAMHKSVVDRMVFVSLNFIFVLATILLLYYRFA